MGCGWRMVVPWTIGVGRWIIAVIAGMPGGWWTLPFNGICHAVGGRRKAVERLFLAYGGVVLTIACVPAEEGSDGKAQQLKNDSSSALKILKRHHYA